MRNYPKRILSVLLCLTLLFTFPITAVLAEGTVETDNILPVIDDDENGLFQEEEQPEEEQSEEEQSEEEQPEEEQPEEEQPSMPTESEPGNDSLSLGQSGDTGIQPLDEELEEELEDPELYYTMLGKVTIEYIEDRQLIQEEPGYPLPLIIWIDGDYFGEHMIDEAGNFTFRILKPVLDQYPDNAYLGFRVAAPGFENIYGPEDHYYTAGDLRNGVFANLIFEQGSYVDVYISFDHLPAKRITPEANAMIGVLSYEYRDWTADAWLFDYPTYWPESYRSEHFFVDFLCQRNSGDHKFAFTYYDVSQLEHGNWAQNVEVYEAGIFQYVGMSGTEQIAVQTLEEAAVFRLFRGEGLQLVSQPWPGDRGHAGEDIYPPHARVQTLSGGDQPASAPITFADVNFKAALLAISGIDADGDNEISYDEAAAVTSLNVSGKNISDLSGIEYFTSLKELNCAANQLGFLDISYLEYLEKLRCYNNRLSSLNVSGLIRLKELSCTNNYILSLDVSGLEALEYLDCDSNKLTTLNVAGLDRLTGLSCSENQISTLDLTNVPALKELLCSDNQLTSLDLSQLPLLEFLGCSNNALTTLTVDNLPALKKLNCYKNALTSLDVTASYGLQYLSCDFNQLTSLNVTGLTALEVLFCNHNRLTSLDLTGLSALISLDCSENTLVTLDLSNQTAALDMLVCSYNLLTALDISGFSGLTYFDCTENYIPSTSAVTGYPVSPAPGQRFYFDPQNIGRPSAPQNVRATADDGKVTLSWEAPLIDGGSPITGYEVWDAELEWISIPGGANARSHTITGLPTDQKYESQIRALNASGGGQAKWFSVYIPARGVLDGIVTISGAAAFGQWITADVSLLSVTSGSFGTFSYQWKRNGAANIGTNSATYQLTQADIGATITVTVTASGCDGSVTSGATAIVTKADGPAAPMVTGDYTGNGTTFTYTVTPISGAEYSKDGISWQEGNSFTGFTTTSPEAVFYARIKATATHEAGIAGSTGPVVFTKLNDRAAPALDYTVSDSFPKTVTITPVADAEYQFNNGGYSTENTYTSHSGEIVTVSIRLAETATHNASPASGATIDTANQNQAAPAAFTLTWVGVGDTSYTVMIPATQGAEYSFDGMAWGSGNTKTGCLPGDTVTGYKRMAAKTGYHASPATSAGVILPLFQVKTPTAVPDGGNFTTSQSVTLACATAGASIHYTTDGTTPSVGSTQYNGAFTLTAATTVKAIAVKSGMVDSEVMAVTFTKVSGGGSGGGSSSNITIGGGKSPVAGAGNATQPIVVPVNLDAAADQDGNAIVAITDTMVKEAVEKAQAEAKRLGKTAGGIIIEIKVTTANGMKSLMVTVHEAALGRLDTAGASLGVSSAVFRFTLDDEAVKDLKTQASGTVTFTATPVTRLSDAASAAIGSRPVFDFTVKDDTGKVITSYGKGTITRGIKYTAVPGEKTGSLFIVMIVDDKVQWIDKSSYNSGWMIWGGNSNSVYGVGCNPLTPAYTDTTNHWAKENIDFAASRNLISGTGATVFSPDTAITRADFLMALGKLSAENVSGYTTSSFTDVPNTNPAMPYIEWAVKNKIAQGVDDNKFAPNAVITREQMAVMMVNYGSATGYTLPVPRQAVIFADDAKISSYAKEAVRAIQQTGVISSKPNNLFDPQGSATRAEASTILRRFVELVIDEDTARGWVQNDAGQWYYFYADGRLATNTIIDGYPVGEDGTWRE